MIFWKIRCLLFYLMVVFFLIVLFIFFCLPVYLFTSDYSYRYKIAKLFSHIFIVLLKYICNVRYNLSGEDLLPKNAPYILAPNHQSFWDNIFVQIIMNKNSWVIKKELYRIPFFGIALRIMKPIAVNREAYISVRQIIEQGVQKLRNGISLVIFPEGGRVPYQKNVKLKPSCARLAFEAKVPIVLMVHNAGKVWPKGFWINQGGGVITVKIIKRIDIDQLHNFDSRSLTKHMEIIINKEKNLL